MHAWHVSFPRQALHLIVQLNYLCWHLYPLPRLTWS